MRTLGDVYVKAGRCSDFHSSAHLSTGNLTSFTEFRRHQRIDNPLHIIGFLSQWKLYLDELPSSPTDAFRGRKLDPTLLEKVQVEDMLCQEHADLMHIWNCRCRQNKLASCTRLCTPREMCGKRRLPRPATRIRMEIKLNSAPSTSSNVSRRVLSFRLVIVYTISSNDSFSSVLSVPNACRLLFQDELVLLLPTVLLDSQVAQLHPIARLTRSLSRVPGLHADRAACLAPDCTIDFHLKDHLLSLHELLRERDRPPYKSEGCATSSPHTDTNSHPHPHQAAHPSSFQKWPPHPPLPPW